MSVRHAHAVLKEARRGRKREVVRGTLVARLHSAVSGSARSHRQAAFSQCCRKGVTLFSLPISHHIRQCRAQRKSFELWGLDQGKGTLS